MTPDEHLDKLVAQASRHMRQKYLAGQREHGGQLWRKPLDIHLLEEVVDMMVYTLTVLGQHVELQKRLGEGLTALRNQQWSYAEKHFRGAYNIATTGNPEGEVVTEHVEATLDLEDPSLLAGAESSSPKVPPPNSKNLDHSVMAAAEAAVQHHLARTFLSLSKVLSKVTWVRSSEEEKE